MLAIVDVQYFPHGKSKILKEACILPLHGLMSVQHYVIKPPFALSHLSNMDLCTVNYIQYQMETVHWNEGSHELTDFTSQFPPNSILLCNGLEKMVFLQSLLPLCIIVNCNVSYNHIVAPAHICCPFRKHRQCAFLRAYQLYVQLINK